MKVMTVLGTRPEIIRLSRIIPKLDKVTEHTLVHTGQNFDRHLSDVFFDELGLRQPDHHLGVRGASAGEQIGQILSGVEKLLHSDRPDRLLLLGDTNSSLCAMIAKRMGIPVYHMEAGNRCYDDRVPEEVNRRIIDHSSDILLPYTEHSRRHLLSEGLHPSRIYVTGNPIYEVIRHYTPQIEKASPLKELKVKEKEFFLVTLHRAENVDVPERLEQFLLAFKALYREYGKPLIISTHPRLRNQMQKQGVATEGAEGLHFIDPLGFFSFVHLEQKAFCTLTDSGTVQEECAIFKVPSVTLRDVTERPETLDCGANLLSGADAGHIQRCVARATQSEFSGMVPPREYTQENVSDTVVNLLLSHRR